MDKMTVKVFELEALADEIGVTYDYLRHVVLSFQKGEITEFRGYSFFGQPYKPWYGYKVDSDLEVVKSPRKDALKTAKSPGLAEGTALLSFPEPIWELLRDARMKRVLQKIALDPEYKQEIFNTIPENRE